jgi:hypothetical protein
MDIGVVQVNFSKCAVQDWDKKEFQHNLHNVCRALVLRFVAAYAEAYSKKLVA